MGANEDHETNYLRHPQLDRNRSSSSRSLASRVLGGISFAGDGELQQSHLPFANTCLRFRSRSDSWSTANISSSEYPILITPVRKNVIFSKHVLRRRLSPFLASLPLLYSVSPAPALMSRSSGRSCARSHHSRCPYPAVTLRLRRYSQFFALPLHRFLQIIQKTLSHRVPGRDRQESFNAKRVACFVGSALGVYARWSQMGAGDLSLLI